MSGTGAGEVPGVAVGKRSNCILHLLLIGTACCGASGPNYPEPLASFVTEKGDRSTSSEIILGFVPKEGIRSQPLSINLGLGDVDTYTYNPDATMASYDFAVGATPTHMTGGLTWNQNGSLRQLAITDGFHSGGTQTCNYGTSSAAGYDELGRLVKVDCGASIWQQNFSYDPFNNLTKSVPTGGTGIAWNPGYNQANNHQNNSTYDSNGSLLTDTFHTYTWEQHGLLNAITDTGATFTYNALGQLAEKGVSGTYTEYLYTPLGKTGTMNGTTVTNWLVPIPGGLHAEKTPYFWHKDWLGSVRLSSSKSGRVSMADRAYAPYGEIYTAYQNASEGVDFTGDLSDKATGTYDTPNRELNPTQGRWISVDPAHASWNGYGYSTNPLGTVDPTGNDMMGDTNYDFDWLSGEGWLGEFEAVPTWSLNRDESLLEGDILAAPPNIPVTVDPSLICNDNCPPGIITLYSQSCAFCNNSGVGFASRDLSPWGFQNCDPAGGCSLILPQPKLPAANNGPSWWGTFFRSFGNGLLNGVRPPGQTFTECVNQNVSDTTFGTVDPKKLFNQGLNMAEETAALLAATKLPTAVGVSVPVGPYVVGQLARLAGLGSTGTGIAIRAGAAGMQTLAVGGAATVGMAIGSAINCR